MVKSIPKHRTLVKTLHCFSHIRRLQKAFTTFHRHQAKSSQAKSSQAKSSHLSLDPIKNHFYTFQPETDLFTLLYTSMIFKWINTDRILIITNSTPKRGYQLELFLRSFQFAATFLDSQMPINTNAHFYNQFLKGATSICITHSTYPASTSQYGKLVIDNSPIPITVIYFDTVDVKLLEYHSFHANARAIYHLMSNKEDFVSKYATLDRRVVFEKFQFDVDQMAHLRYRCEDVYHGITKNDVKKEKMRKINVELLHSKKMKEFFQKNPMEKSNVVKAIEENSIKNNRAFTSYIPSYLIHQENNQIADAIRNTYDSTNAKGRRRNKKGKMEEYFEALDKGDGSHEMISF